MLYHTNNFFINSGYQFNGIWLQNVHSSAITENSHHVPNNLAADVYDYAMVTSEKKKLGGKIVVIN